MLDKNNTHIHKSKEHTYTNLQEENKKKRNAI